MAESWKAAGGGKPVQLADLGRVADELLKSTTKRVWLFYGEMGSGKTTLIKALCEALGVAGVMSSPTFSIVNEYLAESSEVIYHFDFYRLKNEAEALDIGIEEYLDSGNYCFLEWPDKISGLIPGDSFKIKLKEETPTTRTIEYSA